MHFPQKSKTTHKNSLSLLGRAPFLAAPVAAVAARAPALDPFGQRGGQRPQVLGGDVDAADAAVEGVVGDVLFLKRER